MNDLDDLVFINLFKDACTKCFGHSLKTPLSESESKLFCNEILDKIGLVIGWKSVKNYSAYILSDSPGKQENPSMATLDTLSRYVLNAPYTDEIKRKNNESHYPYWFNYKNTFIRSSQKTVPENKPRKKFIVIVVSIVVIVLLISFYFFQTHPSTPVLFIENFHSLNEDSLNERGWFIQSKDANYWNKRSDKPGYLTLFTLKGDNWPDSANQPGIKNLLLRKITGECFTAEVHLTDFIPKQNWQQAGILLLEDTNFTGKSLRLSILYNDYSGASPKSSQIVVQAITSLGKGYGKPEEISHIPILYPDSLSTNPGLTGNIENAALRIEKNGNKFRLLYAGGMMENSAFKEIVSREFDMRPKYIGIFALKGFVNNADNMPAHFKFFSLANEPCDK